MRRTLFALGTSLLMGAAPFAAPAHAATPAAAKPPPVRVITAPRDSAFTTPSGAITCTLMNSGRGRMYTRCDVLGNRWRVRRPAGCDTDYGNSIGLSGTRRGAILCAGDTVVGTSRQGTAATAWFRSKRDVTVRQYGMRVAGLRYGYALRVGDTTCTSTTAGVTCVNTARHGFFASRETYRTW